MDKFELDGNGFVFNLFHLLWVQDPIFKNNIKIDIPDTVQIIQGQPYFWYYSSESQIKRKSKSKLTVEDVEEAFIKNKEDNSEICAVWITQEGQSTVFEYHSQYSLSQLLKKLSYETVGYIQRFIYPKGQCNQVIKCTWGNRLCFFEQYTNKYPLALTKADIYQRAVTFEMNNGPVEYTTLKGTQLCQRLELFCGLIVSHVNNVTQNQKDIIQLEIYFKQSNQNKIYLMFCSRVQCYSNHGKVIPPPTFQLTKKIATQLVNYPKAITLADNSKCLGCDKNKNEIEFSQVRLRDVVNYWEHHSEERRQVRQLRTREVTMNNKIHQQIKIDPIQTIPKIFRTIWPRLSYQEYLELRYNPCFLNQSMQLCSECFTKMFGCEQKLNGQPKIKECPKRYCKTETIENDHLFSLSLPAITLKQKRNLYISFLEHRTVANYAEMKLSSAQGVTGTESPVVKPLKTQSITSIFKTTQSSGTGRFNQKDFE